MTKYSVILPIKNEEENLAKLVEELDQAMTPLNQKWELICVDDGSTDGSVALLQQLKKDKPYIRILIFSENYGQSSALAAGFEAAVGEIVITLDADGQNNPADILKLLEALPGHDMVCGWRQNRRDPVLKKCIGRIANYIRSRYCGDHVHDTGCQLRAYRREKLANIRKFHGMHRFLPALFRIEGYSIKEVPVHHRARMGGQSKYTLFNRGLSLVTDMLAVRWMRNRRLRYRIKDEL